MKKVFMYTLSTCPWCKKAKEFFEEKNIPYEYVDYDLEDKESRKEILSDMKNSGGTTATPFVKIGDEVVVGYNPKKYAQLLGLEEEVE
ncbi:glutaredoxin family protein [Methanosalsum zhilinae]|nr:glutaredoxin family protein [Methanosalsum zhilinae]